MAAQYSMKLERLAETDPRIQEGGYDHFGPGEEAPHWLYLNSGYSVDGCHIINGATIKECLEELSTVIVCDCKDCEYDKRKAGPQPVEE
jgi:hypothetical protein